MAAALLLAGCAGSGGSTRELIAVKDARSIAAEWALVNHLAASGRLRPSYARTMREEAIGQIETILAGLKNKDSEAGREIGALAQLPPDAPDGQIYAYAQRLQAMEDKLEAR